ncbi:MAG: fumarate hydratase [Verrucomicrobiota bacterium]|nr:fumarate hydratase [Verrucomicrobiota bacterium]
MKREIYNLIKKTSTILPSDVCEVLKSAQKKEEKGSSASETLENILKNIEIAAKRERPLCQDTGTITFFVKAPKHIRNKDFVKSAESAIIEATKDGFLRQNSVCPITGKNSGNNLGPGNPRIYWEETEGKEMQIELLLKGGGCENVCHQYSLPDTSLNAGRDFCGVRKCILDAVVRAQGRGCAPGILSVIVGGDRSSGYSHGKKLFLRKMGERSLIPELAKLEQDILSTANSLGIGPMGLGGKTTLLDVFIEGLNRVPASYFVTVNYMCWACRRQTLIFQ